MRGLLIALAAVCTLPSFGATCESLRGVEFPHTKIVLAEAVAAGEFQPADQKVSPQQAAQYKRLPAFCRVAAEIMPTGDSQIGVEVWMPAAHWNQKLQGEGNGGFAGSISFNQMAGALARNYVTVATDTGHQGSATDAEWALKHPEKIIDFGYRGIHEMTTAAKALAQAFYGETPQRSYFVGCSDGGREALMEAQRFPGDYDGILAGAPANNWTHLLTAGADVTATLMKDDASYIPSSKIPAISKAVLGACDAQDGVKDGIVNDPSKCNFDASALLCAGAETEACLTAAQVRSLKKIYAGGLDSKRKPIFPGLMPGGEEGDGGWKNWVLGTDRGKGEGSSYVNGFFRNMVFDNPAWTHGTTTVDMDLQTADEKMAKHLNANDPNLRAFEKRGGKLILYHGWNDPAISPLNTIDYYNRVLAKMGPGDAEKFVRLYMVPGMQHCYGGPGPSAFGQFPTLPEKSADSNIYAALEQWVEKGMGPSDIQATKYTEGNPAKGVAMTRPLCTYPKVARYKGTGDTNDAGSFVCAGEGSSETTGH
ncbi:MAG: Tannase and feruloyl esterase [Bryobacterales bacterium]|nr:Tannase and feruloyl esterase [Bryobacterales bacterium]